MGKTIGILVSLLIMTGVGWAQTPNTSEVDEYINQYKNLAISEQIRTGIPAAITLAQGIYETGAGTSDLCVNAKNHFGIKCKKSWDGPTYLHDDDRPGECFRKYQNARQSFMDHSDFLKNNPRYERLFKIKATNYKKWAIDLRECGYATNKHYGKKLIDYIEKYDLENYTLQAIKDERFIAKKGRLERDESEDSEEPLALLSPKNDPQYPESDPTENGTQIAEEQYVWPTVKWDSVKFYQKTRKNGLKGFYAPEGALLLEYSIKHHVRYGSLLRWNNLPDTPLEANMFIYLESKRKTGKHPYYKVKEGEGLLQISQATGVDLNQIRTMNRLKPGEEPAPGTQIYLQGMVATKAAIILSKQPNENNVEPAIAIKKSPAKEAVKKQSSNYIYLQKDIKKPVSIREADRQKVPKNPQESVKEKSNLSTTSEVHLNSAGINNPDTLKKIKPEIRKIEQPEAVKSEKEQKPLTRLEKLRARMDKIVYDDEQTTSANQGDNSQLEEKENVQSQTQSTEGISSDSQSVVPEKSLDINPTEKLKAYMNSTKQSKKDPVRTTLPPGRKKNKAPIMPSNGRVEKPRYYTVGRGDTAFSIAKRFDISVSQLKEWNHLPKSMVVQKGQRLRIAP